MASTRVLRASALLASLAFCACARAPAPTIEFGPPPPSESPDAAAHDGADASAIDAGSGFMDAGFMDAGKNDAGTQLSQLSFDVLTHSQHGQYAPANVGAIWIETDDGAFVKTLATWYFIRVSFLRKFIADTGGNRVDAVSGASLRRHETHHATWDLTDSAGARVQSGKFQLLIEVADDDQAGQWLSIPFDASAGPKAAQPADVAAYSAMRLELH